MRTPKLQIVVAGLSMTAVLAVGWQVQAEPTRTTFPELDKLVHYTTVKRGNVTEHIMTTPAAIDAVKNRQPIPAGTHFVLVDYREGKVFRYFVMEKGQGWGADYDERRRTGDWQFQWFWPDKSINTAENTARCQSCHQSQSGAEHLFTGSRIPRFNGTPIE
ncbi:cytochrome P460 family protein [Bosea sp. 124]|uniref:cytochrome P460 family protein n=1 Tax=Bosea sp. 124 TaxID=2135642 RepID=UPI000D393DA7|nr:cytochrome P460 family protein [Bosea sp. 124]PTM39501.1 cytochrome P460 [Bosea sp. 124]